MANATYVKAPKAPRAPRTPRGAKPINHTFKDFFNELLKAHQKAFLLSLRTLKTQPFSAWLTIIAISIILVLPLGSYLVFNQLNEVQQHFDRGNQLTVFLNTKLTQSQVDKLMVSMLSVEEIESIEYETPQKALKEFEEKTNLTDIIALLPENPLGGVLVITPKGEYQTLESMQAIKEMLSGNPHIDKVVMDLEWVEKFEAMSRLIGKFVTILSLFIGLGCIIILTNTIRLSLEKHSDEIEILSLIGATPSYISRPFTYRAMIYGTLGSLIAIGMVLIGLHWLKGPSLELGELYQQAFHLDGVPLQAAFGLVFFSIFLSWLSAKFAIWQYNERLR